MKRILISSLLLFFLTSCSSIPVAAPTSVPSSITTATKTLTPLPTITPSATPLATSAVPQSALLFEQNFASDPDMITSPEISKWFTNNWGTVHDTLKNQNFYCNQKIAHSDTQYYGHPTDESYLVFGNNKWSNYAVELQIKPTETQDSFVEIFARYDDSNSNLGYYGAWNLKDGIAGTGFGDPYHPQSQKSFLASANIWHTLRLEVFGNSIKFYIDNQLITTMMDSKRSQGKAGLFIEPQEIVCVANIRVWALTNDGTPEPTSSNSSPKPIFNASSNIDLYPQVWSFNSSTSQSWEYKVNCGTSVNSAPLKSCFLWDVDQVIVTTPSGLKIPLQKDFNINSYSGEETKRWVIYGPSGGGLPESGVYTFAYIKNGQTLLTQQYTYTQKVLSWPVNVSVQQSGNDLHVGWQPPKSNSPNTSYKVIIFNTAGAMVTSKNFPPGYSIGDNDLINPPLNPGTTYQLNITLGAPDIGFSESEWVRFTWQAP